MASLVPTTNGFQVRWKKGKKGTVQSEWFEDRLPAEQFKLLVEHAGNAWPEGWVKGHGFVTEDNPLEDPQDTNCTPLLKYAQRRVEALRESRSIGEDTMRKYLRYARIFTATLPVARQLAEILDGEDELRMRMLSDYTSVAHLIPGIEAVVDTTEDACIEDIDKDTIAVWVRYMRVAGKSTKTIRNYHGFLHGLFEEAVEDDIIERNPCASTKLGVNVPVVKKVVLEPSEFWLIHECMRPDYQDFIETAVGTGMRFGELTALTVDDWDSEAGLVTVNKAWKRAMTGHAVGKPKTDAGVRAVFVEVGGRIAEILDKHAVGKEGDDLLFTAPWGGRIRQNVFGTSAWQVAVAQARLEKGLKSRPRFHDLRHTHISWLRDQGLADVAIKDLVGHSDDAMTGKYGSVTQETIQRATRGISERMKRPD